MVLCVYSGLCTRHNNAINTFSANSHVEQFYNVIVDIELQFKQQGQAACVQCVNKHPLLGLFTCGCEEKFVCRDCPIYTAVGSL